MSRRFSKASQSSPGIKGLINPTATLQWKRTQTLDGGSGLIFGTSWSPELGLFAIVGHTNTNRILTSPNGFTWTARTAPVSANWTHMAWSPKLNRFVALSDFSTITMYSNDGLKGMRCHQGAHTLACFGVLSLRSSWPRHLGQLTAWLHPQTA
jgi:hypothetical protein